ncbi:MAG: hypothetical protein JNJ59_07345 [Deltaproteobacteria bacterium]|nr:hypothetical protein [Deltaproteobacteria bacterium]
MACDAGTATPDADETTTTQDATIEDTQPTPSDTSDDASTPLDDVAVPTDGTLADADVAVPTDGTFVDATDVAVPTDATLEDADVAVPTDATLEDANADSALPTDSTTDSFQGLDGEGVFDDDASPDVEASNPDATASEDTVTPNDDAADTQTHTDAPEVSVSPCELAPCDPAATCVVDASVQGFHCVCPVGFSGDGTLASPCADIDACVTSPCRGSASCVDLAAPAPDTQAGRVCSCLPGERYWESIGCYDIDECAELVSACGPNQICTNEPLGFDCSCRPGTAPLEDGSCAKVTKVSVKGSRSCAITEAGSLYCWGVSTSDRTLGDGTQESRLFPVPIGPPSGWTDVSVGSLILGIREGRLYKWGPNDTLVPTQIGDQDGWTAVASGGGHSCALRGGELYCWGNNSRGQLGDGTWVSQDTPTRIGGATTWTQVTVGHAHTCGLRTSSGDLYCWGSYWYDLDSYDLIGLTPIYRSTGWTAVDGRYYHVCGIQAGMIHGWGNTVLHQLTHPGWQTLWAANGWTAVSAGLRRTCGVNSGAIHCHESSDGINVQNWQVGTDTNWESISITDTYGCGIRAGMVWCWGEAEKGLLGDGRRSNAPWPVQIGTASDWTTISAGTEHSCGIRAGKLFCWGTGAALGDGTLGPAEPTQIGLYTDWVSVSAGYRHTAAVRANGTAYVWGMNDYGQSGADPAAHADVRTPLAVEGTAWQSLQANSFSQTCGLQGGLIYCLGAENRLDPNPDDDLRFWEPAPINASSGWQSLSGGTDGRCATRAGELWCWGTNTYGSLGVGDKLPRSTPTRVGDASDWTMVSGGWYTTCGLRAGALYCWGSNAYGALGLEGVTQALVPTRIGTDTDWVSISTSGERSCGVRAGQAYCWGRGELGLGELQRATTPTRLDDHEDWTAIDLGSNSALGIRAGKLYAWGDNRYSQLGYRQPTEPRPVLFE